MKWTADPASLVAAALELLSLPTSQTVVASDIVRVAGIHSPKSASPEVETASKSQFLS